MEGAEFLTDEESAIKIFGKVINIPRKQCAYGDEGTSYKFSGIEVDGKTWDSVPVLNLIKEYINEELKVPVNFVLVNLYKSEAKLHLCKQVYKSEAKLHLCKQVYQTGDDYIGYKSEAKLHLCKQVYHSDDEKDLDGNYPIVSLSFGVTRPFLLKHKVTGQVYEYCLTNNSCILMEPPCQKLRNLELI